MTKVIKMADAIKRMAIPAKTLSTGIPKLDKVFGNLKAGEVTVVSGQETMALRDFGLNLFCMTAESDKTATLYYPIMSGVEHMVKRVLSIQTGYATDEITNDMLETSYKHVELGNRATMLDAFLSISEALIPSAAEIREDLEADEKKQVRLVIVENIQLVTASTEESRSIPAQGEAVFIELIRMAQECQVHIILLAEETKPHRCLKHREIANSVWLRRDGEFLTVADYRKVQEGNMEDVVFMSHHTESGGMRVLVDITERNGSSFELHQHAPDPKDQQQK